MYRGKPLYGVPRLTRRELLTALAGVIITPNTVTAAPAGFHVTGPLTATELERQEGYVNLGKDLMLATHPKSPIYGNLTGLIGETVRVSVVPE